MREKGKMRCAKTIIVRGDDGRRKGRRDSGSGYFGESLSMDAAQRAARLLLGCEAGPAVL
jgi:hypothetical protein